MKRRFILFLLFVGTALRATDLPPFEKAVFTAYSYSYYLCRQTVESTVAWMSYFQGRDTDAIAVFILDEFISDYVNQSQTPTPAFLEEVLAHFPMHDDLLNSCAWTYYLSEENDERAYELIRKVRHHTLATLDSYAMIELQCGHPSDALQRILPLLKHARLQPEIEYAIGDYMMSMTLFDHGGDIFYKNKHYIEAAYAWAESLAVAQCFLNEAQLSPEDLLPYDYDFQWTKQKYQAIIQKLKQANDATE